MISVPGTDQAKFSVQVYSWSVPGTLSRNSGFQIKRSIIYNTFAKGISLVDTPNGVYA